MIQPPNSGSLAQMFAQLAAGLEAPQDPLEDRVAAARAAAARKDILGWGKAVMPGRFHLPYCGEMHGYFVKIRHEPLTDTEAPRDHAKTAIKCNLIPLFQALEEPELFDYYLNIQATMPKALAVNLGIKLELEQNEVLREVYGDQVGADKWTDQLFVLKNGVVFHAVGAGQSIRGTNYRLRRPNYAIGDDLYDEEHINNPEATLKINSWFWSTVYPMMAEDRRTSVHVQGTAINDADLLKELSTKPGVVYKHFAAIDDTARTALWPELKTYAQRCAQRDLMPSVIFAREYQNERRDDSSSIVKASWLQGWEFDPASLKFDGRTNRLLAVFLPVDPSIGAKVENDKTGMAVILKTQRSDARGADYWITHLVNEHLSLDARILRMQEIIDRQPAGMKVTKARIEAVAGFKDFAAEARRRLTGAGVEEVNVVKDKISVLESKSWHFENKKVHVSTAIPKALRDELFYQLTVNHPQNDDLRDAVLLALDSSSKQWGEFL
jgi:hypothetical protein